MSKIALSGNASGTGTLTIAAPNTNTDRTLNLPDAAGEVFVSGQPLSATTGSFSGNVTFGSSVLATPTGTAPSFTCRAWVNFNGTTSPGTIRASGNVSSVTRQVGGVYTVNFATAMPDTNYALSGSADNSDAWWQQALGFWGGSGNGGRLKSTTQARIFTSSTGRQDDSQEVSAMFFR
jgi:hypothetical protein